MKLNNIDLNKLRLFQSVMRNGNYRLAGEEMGLTRSAISQGITTLESQLGTPLFQRKGKKLFPTQGALKLEQVFSQYQSELENCLQNLMEEDLKVEGWIRIGSYYEYGKHYLVDQVKKFCTQYPDVRVKFLFDSPTRLQRLLEQGKLDMTFSIFAHKGVKEIESTPVFEQELVLIAPKSLGSQAHRLDTLLQLPLVEYFTTHHLIPKWIRWHFNTKRRIEPQIYAASAEMVVDLVAKGLGVGVVPEYLVFSKLRSQVSVIRPTQKKWIEYIWLNQFKGQYAGTAHEKFYNFVVNSSQQV